VIALVNLQPQSHGILLGHPAKMHRRANLHAADAQADCRAFRRAQIGPRLIDLVVGDADDGHALGARQLYSLGTVFFGDIGDLPQQIEV